VRLNEFADPKTYAPSADDMAAIIKQVKRIWRDNGIEADAPMILSIMHEPENKKDELIASMCRKISCQLHRRRLSIREPSRKQVFDVAACRIQFSR
jgi:hypothetical protein